MEHTVLIHFTSVIEEVNRFGYLYDSAFNLNILKGLSYVDDKS